jgi:hypothetical protein
MNTYITEFNNRWGKWAATVGDAPDTNIKTAVGVFAALKKCEEAKAVILLATFPDYYKLTVNSVSVQQAELSYIHVTLIHISNSTSRFHP